MTTDKSLIPPVQYAYGEIGGRNRYTRAELEMLEFAAKRDGISDRDYPVRWMELTAARMDNHTCAAKATGCPCGCGFLRGNCNGIEESR